MIWYNKERIVFAVIGCILLWHVYTLLNPKEEKAYGIGTGRDCQRLGNIRVLGEEVGVRNFINCEYRNGSLED